jgi:hypothetical protein
MKMEKGGLRQKHLELTCLCTLLALFCTVLFFTAFFFNLLLYYGVDSIPFSKLFILLPVILLQLATIEKFKKCYFTYIVKKWLIVLASLLHYFILTIYIVVLFLILFTLCDSIWYTLMRESLFLALFAVAFPWLLLAVLFTRHLLHGVKCWPFLLAIIAIFTVIFYSMELYVSVESLYPKNVRELKTRYSGACTLENVWNIAVEYNSKFIFTYGKPIPKPRQFLIEIKGMDPLCDFSRIFTSRLAAVAGTGACEDFALGLTALLRDAFGCETRIVIFETWIMQCLKQWLTAHGMCLTSATPHPKNP